MSNLVVYYRGTPLMDVEWNSIRFQERLGGRGTCSLNVIQQTGISRIRTSYSKEFQEGGEGHAPPVFAPATRDQIRIEALNPNMETALLDTHLPGDIIPNGTLFSWTLFVGAIQRVRTELLSHSNTLIQADSLFDSNQPDSMLLDMAAYYQHKARLSLECVDNNELLDRLLLLDSWPAITYRSDEVVTDLLTPLAAFGITAGTIETGPALTDDLTADYATPQRVLSDLMAATGYVAYVDFARRLHFHPPASKRAHFEIRDDSYNWNKLEIEKVSDLYRNTQYIRRKDGTVSTHVNQAEIDARGVVARMENAPRVNTAEGAEQLGDALLTAYSRERKRLSVIYRQQYDYSRDDVAREPASERISVGCEVLCSLPTFDVGAAYVIESLAGNLTEVTNRSGVRVVLVEYNLSLSEAEAIQDNAVDFMLRRLRN